MQTIMAMQIAGAAAPAGRAVQPDAPRHAVAFESLMQDVGSDAGGALAEEPAPPDPDRAATAADPADTYPEDEAEPLLLTPPPEQVRTARPDDARLERAGTGARSDTDLRASDKRLVRTDSGAGAAPSFREDRAAAVPGAATQDRLPASTLTDVPLDGAEAPRVAEMQTRTHPAIAQLQGVERVQAARAAPTNTAFAPMSSDLHRIDVADGAARSSQAPAFGRFNATATPPPIIATPKGVQPVPAGEGALLDAEVRGFGDAIGPSVTGETAPAASSGRPEATTTQPTAPRPTMQQIAEALPRQEGRATEITLDPEELGRVRMVLSAQDGTLTLSVTAERGETLDLMRRHAESLAQQYREMGFSDIDFSFGEERRPAGSGTVAADGTETEQPSGATSAARSAAATSGALDLRL